MAAIKDKYPTVPRNRRRSSLMPPPSISQPKAVTPPYPTALCLCLLLAWLLPRNHSSTDDAMYTAGTVNHRRRTLQDSPGCPLCLQEKKQTPLFKPRHP
ncbi:hypothetical protein M0R45_005031 [Rubus argutus]|uniref:Uncharacterized protein n=1 Tax=Rubus argutus TaxID=59490 RepID=A0AAW1YLJ5_RUBAR